MIWVHLIISQTNCFKFVADPYDTGDHNQDGYGVYQWARFINNFTFYNFFPEGEPNDSVYITAYPEEMAEKVSSIIK